LINAPTLISSGFLPFLATFSLTLFCFLGLTEECGGTRVDGEAVGFGVADGSLIRGRHLRRNFSSLIEEEYDSHKVSVTHFGRCQHLNTKQKKTKGDTLTL
jgi:hypothetical protein